jgi:hypothetical protein
MSQNYNEPLIASEAESAAVRMAESKMGQDEVVIYHMVCLRG